MGSAGLYQKVTDAAQARYGPAAEVRFKMVGGKAQCWVAGIGNGEAVTAGSYKDLLKLLTRTPVAPTMGQEEKTVERVNEGGLIDSTQAAKVLGCSRSAILSYHKRGLLKAKAFQVGRGGKHGRQHLFDRSEVEAMIGKVRTYKKVRASKSGGRVRPSRAHAAAKGGVLPQMNVTNFPESLHRRCEALVETIRKESVFTQQVTLSSVVRVAVEIGLAQLEKEHAKR